MTKFEAATDAPALKRLDFSDRVYKKMDPDIKAKWLTALRSGERGQTTGALNRLFESGNAKPGFCCLGVLCEVGVADGVVERRDNGPMGDSNHMAEYRHPSDGPLWVDTMPSEEIQAWAALDDVAAGHLAEMNDTGSYTFAQIADFIEERL